MSRQPINESIRRLLEDNPNILHVTDKTIQYSPEFKLSAVKAYQEGKTPYEILSSWRQGWIPSRSGRIYRNNR